MTTSSGATAGVPGRGKPAVREKVLRAALEAAAAAAPGPVKVADIAALAGMSAGHVMYYFGSRDRILVETLLHAESELAARRDKRLAEAADAEQALRTLVRTYLPGGRGDARWKLWAQLLASPPQDRPTLAAFADLLDAWSRSVARVVRDGVASGVFRCDDPDDLGYRACRLMDGYALEVLLGTQGRSRTWAVDAVVAALLRELRPA